MIPTLLVWILATALGLLILFHIRLRRSISQLSESLRQPGQALPAKFDRFTPSYVRELYGELHRQLEERNRIATRETQLQRLLQSIVDEFEDGFLIVSQDLNISFANTAARDRFGAGREIIDRQVIAAFLDHRIVQVIKEAQEQGRKRDRTIHLEERVTAKGETMERYVTIEAAPLPYPIHGMDGVWVIMRDESERFHLEQIRKDFVANASHELRTPLSIITGYLENLAQGDVTDPGTARRFYQVMHKHALRLGRIVEDMLTISKLEGDPGLLRRELFNLCESVTDVIEHLQPMIQEKRARMILNLPAEGLSIRGDRFYWDQIVFNLVENSLKQNTRENLEIEVSITTERDSHVIKVRDNGVGIPGNHLPHVFKRFYRVETSHSQKVKGTGLGLSIVRRAVEAHGGTIQVVSRPGILTEFIIRLPQPAEASGESIPAGQAA